MLENTACVGKHCKLKQMAARKSIKSERLASLIYHKKLVPQAYSPVFCLQKYKHERKKNFSQLLSINTFY